MDFRTLVATVADEPVFETGLLLAAVAATRTAYADSSRAGRGTGARCSCAVACARWHRRGGGASRIPF